ncbi:mitochondrial import protein Pam17 [Tricharina praecox]|uniref:mitochondrial import protein Pam17 n=1 Tax=Tricharina praecox TaxID=43433 RepID=UPI00221E5230|nr:mitochondrial import protein Pam17 [Tricharina praecox]KAI5851906.1 mitochondrial import protein Pam17 [Tricharina praecox]
MFPPPRAILRSLPAAPSTTTLLRSASTSTGTSTTTTTHSNTAAAAAPTGQLSWDTFLQLRRLRRRYNLASSVVTSFAGTMAGMGYLANKEIDVTQTILGMDPLIMFGLATVGCGAAGWLVGPSLGGATFNLLQKRWVKQISVKEKEFLNHIKKNRVDPSFQSFSNPVPDYYGEKIGSVKQYRQWLKDQRAYNKKREAFL